MGHCDTLGHTSDICRKWYKRLGFPAEYDSAFEQILGECSICADTKIQDYDLEESDGRKNLLSFLYMCEELERRYREVGIGSDILTDTVRDIVLWTKAWTDVRGELCLFELPWLAWHMKMKLYRLGSLEFVPATAEYSCPELSLSKGDPIVEIHIPNGADISPVAVSDSIKRAKEFFAKFYPDHNYGHFTFHSWIMDEELRGLLSEGSNILRFQDMFVCNPDGTSEDYAALRYVFGWDATRENIRSRYPTSSFAQRLQRHVTAGGKLHVGFGAMRK